MSNWKTYGKIKKLLTSGSTDDVKIGIELLLLHSLELTTEQFYYLNRCHYEQSFFRTPQVIDIDDLQKYWYDRRKQEKKSVRKNTKANK